MFLFDHVFRTMEAYRMSDVVIDWKNILANRTMWCRTLYMLSVRQQDFASTSSEIKHEYRKRP